MTQRTPRRGGGEAHSAISPARSAAFEILRLVGARKGHSDDLLHGHLTERLSLDDRNLTTALVMGVLRWQIALDARIAPLLARPGQKLADPVAVALRLGAFQLLHLDRVPAHAALNESVELCRAAGQPHAAGMVNAVLRRIAAAPEDSGYSSRAAHPAWLVERWTAAYGRNTALAICEYDQHEPVQGSLFGTAAEQLPQIDDGSRLIAELAAAALPNPDKQRPRVWDACAAPGGKTLVLAMRLPHTDVLATDISGRRLTQMQQRLRCLPYADNVRCQVWDAAQEMTSMTQSTAGFELILCDVPCTGTGTLSRNPEIRSFLRPEDIARQAVKQRSILQAAIACLAPGGRLIYSTCSLEPEENEQVVAATLARNPAHQASVEPFITQLVAAGVLSSASSEMLLRTAVRGGALRTLPGTQACDGFYAAVLERNR